MKKILIILMATFVFNASAELQYHLKCKGKIMSKDWRMADNQGEIIENSGSGKTVKLAQEDCKSNLEVTCNAHTTNARIDNVTYEVPKTSGSDTDIYEAKIEILNSKLAYAQVRIDELNAQLNMSVKDDKSNLEAKKQIDILNIEKNSLNKLNMLCVEDKRKVELTLAEMKESIANYETREEMLQNMQFSIIATERKTKELKNVYDEIIGAIKVQRE